MIELIDNLNAWMQTDTGIIYLVMSNALICTFVKQLFRFFVFIMLAIVLYKLEVILHSGVTCIQ